MGNPNSREVMLPLPHRAREEEGRPALGVQPIAHRVELELHRIAAGHYATINEMPSWLRRFTLFASRRRRAFWSFLRPQPILSDYASWLWRQLGHVPTGGLSSIPVHPEVELKKMSIACSQIVSGGNRGNGGADLIYRLWREEADIDYDLRSNLWWDLKSGRLPVKVGFSGHTQSTFNESVLVKQEIMYSIPGGYNLEDEMLYKEVGGVGGGDGNGNHEESRIAWVPSQCPHNYRESGGLPDLYPWRPWSHLEIPYILFPYFLTFLLSMKALFPVKYIFNRRKKSSDFAGGKGGGAKVRTFRTRSKKND